MDTREDQCQAPESEDTQFVRAADRARGCEVEDPQAAVAPFNSAL